MTATSSIQRVHDALDAADCAVRGTSAQCPVPAHGDGAPSLSVTHNGNKVLLNCHAGCDVGDVLDALNLTMADLFDDDANSEWCRHDGAPGSAGATWQQAARYVYTDAESTPLYIQTRYQCTVCGDKTFRPRLPSGKLGLPEGVRVLYRLPDVLAAAREGRTVYVVEGEKDVERLASLGHVATTSVNGAKAKWEQSYTEALTGATVVVVADNDEHGHARARTVAAALAAARIQVTAVRSPIDRKGADVSDHLDAGHDLDELVDLAESDTSDTDPTGVSGDVTWESDTSDTSDTHVVEPDDESLLAGLRDGAWLDAQEFPPLAYAVDGLIPEGFSVLVGPPKAGKSWLLLDVLLAVAAGGYALGTIPTGQKRRVLYLALEDGDRRMQSRSRALLNDAPIPDAFHYITSVEPGCVVATVEAFLRRYPDTALVVIDTLGKVMPPARMGESAYQRDYRVGGMLKRVADEYPGLAVVVAHHDRKAASEDFVEAVSGTHGIAGSADTIVVLARKRQADDATLMVTGRDVAESEYALTLTHGQWTLDGATLDDAAAAVQQREEQGALGDVSTQILDAVRARGDTAPGDLRPQFGKDVDTYLKRLVEAGRLLKPKRGVYRHPGALSEVSEVSETQVTGSTVSDTGPGFVSEASEPSGSNICGDCGTSIPVGHVRCRPCFNRIQSEGNAA